MVLLVDLVEGKLTHKLNDLPWESFSWKNLSELTAIPSSSAHAEETSEAWPESFERGDTYIDHLVDPQAHPMNTEDLVVDIIAVHGLGSLGNTTWTLGNCYSDCIVDHTVIMPTVAHHRELLEDTLSEHISGHHVLPLLSTPGLANRNQELARRLKRLYIRKVLRKALRDKCGVLQDRLSTADGSDQISLDQLSALAKDPLRVWKTGLRAINGVLDNVPPKSVQEVISLILMADSMRNIPCLGAKADSCINEYVFLSLS